jgi:hypothetical protein
MVDQIDPLISKRLPFCIATHNFPLVVDARHYSSSGGKYKVPFQNNEDLNRNWRHCNKIQ